MGKRKSEDELQRFVWKNNVQYDIRLLTEVKSKNPFSRTNREPVWLDVAKALQEGPLKMKVTVRSCRKRVTELLKAHRKNEIQNISALGISEEEVKKLKKLFTSVGALEDAKQYKQLKAFLSNDLSEDEFIRSEALFVDTDSSDDSHDEEMEQSCSSARRSNIKKDLIRFLEAKNEKENELRKEELRIREKEADNKAKEIEMLCAKAEADERTKMIESIVRLMTSE